MNPIQNLTSEDVQRYVRIALQWLAATLVTHGTIKGGAWVEQAIGIGVGAASFIWTLYGNRIQAKIDEITKHDVVAKVLVNDASVAQASPSNKVDVK